MNTDPYQVSAFPSYGMWPPTPLGFFFLLTSLFSLHSFFSADKYSTHRGKRRSESAARAVNGAAKLSRLQAVQSKAEGT